jgi:RluA family pseudouridine synthase
MQESSEEAGREPTPPAGERIALVVPARGEAERIDRFLAEMIPPLSRRAIRGAIARGDVTIGGKPVRIASRPVAPGDFVTLSGDPSWLDPLPALPLLAESPDWAAFSKPPGMLSEPASSTDLRGSRLTALEIARSRSAFGGAPRAFAACVGRLDRPVSGLLLVAKSGGAHGGLVEAFQGKNARKMYLALTDGVPAEESGIVDLAIRRVGPTLFATVRPGEPGHDTARSARSGYRVLARSEGSALVALRLHTGRTHQARLHLASLGCPVAGDSRYGHEASSAPPGTPVGPPPARVFLHAFRVLLRWKGEELRLTAPLPPDLLEKMRERGIADPGPLDGLELP